MKLDSLSLFCTSCREVISEEGPVLLLEDRVPYYFCSDSCAEIFYAPLVKQYKDLEESFLKNNKDCLVDELLGDPALIDQILYVPTEIWKISNHAGESVYHFISELEKGKDSFWGISVSLLRNFNPSFAVTILITKDEDIVGQYRVGEQVDDIAPYIGRNINHDQDSNEFLSEDILTMLEELKSEILALHLENRSEDDIPYEAFTEYDKFLQSTLDGPDEIRTFDELSTPLWCYIKSAIEQDKSFFYLVICFNQGEDESSGRSVVIPVFSFPTIDSKIYNFFRKGKQLFGVPRN